MDKLKELIALCKCSVTVSVNDHRDCYETVAQHLEGFQEFEKTDLDLGDIGKRFPRYEEVDPEVVKKMIELDTVVNIQFYLNSPVGFYRVFHYDLDAALDEALEVARENHTVKT